jgi:hypothetical protein
MSTLNKRTDSHSNGGTEYKNLPHHKMTHKQKESDADLVIENASKRIEFDNPKRRAIVHDFGDKITMNFSNDYPGGVNIEGTVEIPEVLNAGKINVNNVVGKRAAFQHLYLFPVLNNQFDDNLKKEEIFDNMKKLTVTMDNPDDIHKHPVDLASMILNLQEGFKVLNDEIENLKIKIGEKAS